jgi:hypothetical protein
MIINVVTSFNEEGYNTYGKRMLQSFIKFWPKEVNLYVYSEEVAVEERATNLIVIDQKTIKDLTAFKEKFRDNPYANGKNPHGPVNGHKERFKWDAVRFSNKVYAVIHHAKKIGGDCLIWLDADTVTHSPVPLQFLEDLAPAGKESVCYLNRKHWPECGWVMYNLNHPLMSMFFEEWQQLYDTGAFIDLPESHDSYTFWYLTKMFTSRHRARWTEKHIGDSTQIGHVFINSVLGAYMDHLKGPRKNEKRSRPKDLWITRTEDWWKK